MRHRRILALGALSVLGCAGPLSAVTGPAQAAGATAQTAPARCQAAHTRAAFTYDVGSNGAGNETYTLSVLNLSGAPCSLAGPMKLRLRGAGGRPLPTHVVSDPSGGYLSVLPAHGFAQATARFSADIAGPGENGRQCEPVARSLALSIANHVVIAPMDPTPVCEHGGMFLSRLRTPAAATAPCLNSSLQVSFAVTDRPQQGTVDYSLKVRNHAGHACYLGNIPRVRLLGFGGLPLPTTLVTGVHAPYVIGAGTTHTALATLSTSGGRCEAVATHVRVILRAGARALSVPMRPARRVCRGGRVELTSLYLNG